MHFDQFSDDCRLKLLQPIGLNVCEDSDDQLIVTDETFNLYGVGKSITDALSDYEAMAVCFYEDVVEWEGELSPHLQQMKTLLQQYLIPKAVEKYGAGK